jgi:hypothetical protein
MPGCLLILLSIMFMLGVVLPALGPLVPYIGGQSTALLVALSGAVCFGVGTLILRSLSIRVFQRPRSPSDKLDA